MRIESPESFETASMPSAANGSVSARNVSGASSVTPIFSTGQLQPQTSVSTANGRQRAAEYRGPCGAAGGADAGAGSSPYLLWCSARACVTQPSRRMRPGNSCSRASKSSMSRSVQRAICR